MAELTGKLALVTGGGRNVGRAITKALGARGAHVIVNFFHSPEEAARTKAELDAIGASADLIRASVARQDQVARMFGEIEERFGRLDILVNNAASGALLPVDGIGEEHLDRAFGTDVKGSLWCARHAAPLMSKRGGGAIVNVSALGGGQMVMANYLACAVAKAGLETLTRYLAVEYARFGIRVNTASAAMLTSEVADAFPDAEQMQEVIRKATPLGGLGAPDDLANIVAFLASDESRWMTGQILLADGGLSLGASLLSPPIGAQPTQPPPTEAPRPDVRPPQPSRSGKAASAVRERTSRHDEPDEIAIVGMGLVVPGAATPARFWELRTSGAELFVPVPADRWRRDGFYSADLSAEDKSYQDRCGFVRDFVPSGEVANTLPDSPGECEYTTLWLRHALTDALRTVARRDADRCSLILGYTPDGNQHLEEAGVVGGMLHRIRGIVGDMVGDRVPDPDRLLTQVEDVLARRYPRGGRRAARLLSHRVGRLAMTNLLPADTDVLMVDTACSSSLYATDLGAKALSAGGCDIAVCGGAFALGPRGTVLFAKLQGLSRQGAVRALDHQADGVLFADGAAVVVLKRLRRALDDGDRVFGVLRAFGGSSDGKGKAIYAPNAAGQNLAIERALGKLKTFDGPGRDHSVEWIIAHATGTPVGDLTEFNTLRDHYGGDNPVYVTSNKSLIGHTGWAAGAVSIIEALLGFANGQIPLQHRFDTASRGFRLEGSNLKIPTSATPWTESKDGGGRRVAVSGFGFGGTNAHMIVEEYRPGDTARPAPAGTSAPVPAGRPANDRIAIVGWSARLPQLTTPDAVAGWINGTAPDPPASFGGTYPAPPFERVRIPPSTVRAIDRCQLMILECAHELQRQLGEVWTRHSARTGVLVGHLGPTTAAMLYANRCYLDDVGAALIGDERLASHPAMPELIERLRQEVRTPIPASSEDSFPGLMPNVIAARVANRFDLKGPNLVLDSGLASSLSAFEVAGRYLLAGDIDLAIAGGINGNSLPDAQPLLAGLCGDTEVRPAEAVVLFALTTERMAAEAELPVLAYVDGLTAGDATVGNEAAAIQCGTGSPELARYLGAAGALAVLRALHGRPGAASIQCRQADTPAVRLDLTVTAPREDASRGASSHASPQPAPTARRQPDRYLSRDEYAPGRSLRVQRHVPELTVTPRTAVRPQLPFLPEQCCVLTNCPELVDRLHAVPEGTTVLSSAPVPAGRDGWYHLGEPTPDAVAGVLSRRDRPVRHLRVLCDLTRSTPPRASLHEGGESLFALHDLMFCAVKAVAARPDGDGAESVIALLLGALPDGTPHPYVGLFSGLVKCVNVEFPELSAFVLATATDDAAAGAAEAERESAAGRSLPLVFDRNGIRLSPVLREAVVEPSPEVSARLSPDSVVLAVGGARGITAELLIGLARDFGPTLYLIGSNPLDEFPAAVFAGTDEEFAAGRRAFIHERVRSGPGRTVAAAAREFDRRRDARTARRNIEMMARHCGVGRVHYLDCDITDRAAVERAVGAVFDAAGRIDLLIHAAGRHRSALIRDKDLAEFRAVRDVKVRGYLNLKHACRNRAVGTWCNFGSLLGFFGQQGEADYASANDFLATASEYAAATGTTEQTIGWTLWQDAGMGADALTKSYYGRRGFYTAMATGEGIHHFVRELHAPAMPANTLYLGAAERRTVERFYPGFFSADGSTTQHPGFFLRKAISRTADTATFECTFDLSTDPYLNHHRVNGQPTFPGTFVTEIAAEAAQALVPDRHVVGLSDIRLERFLRVHEGRRPTPKRIHARVLDRDESQGTVAVEVRVTTDIVAPTGAVLAADRLHFAATVLLASAFPPAPRWRDWGNADGQLAVPDPYVFPGAPVVISGDLVSTTETRLHPRGNRGQFRLAAEPDHPIWSRFLVPPLLLDGLARLGVLNIVEERLMPVAALTSIRHIGLYQRANDVELAAAHARVELYATVTGGAGHNGGAGGTGGNGVDGGAGGNGVDGALRTRFVATDADGRVLVEMMDIGAHVLGYVDARSGRLVRSGDGPLPVRTIN